MEGDEHHHEGQRTARDQERLLLLARLHSAGPVESLITQLVRDSMGANVAVTPGIEYALSASADEAAAAGESAGAWQARQAAWVNVGPCDDDLPHADAPDRLAQAVANLRDVGLWPWVEGSASEDTRYDLALAPVRILLRDPCPGSRDYPNLHAVLCQARYAQGKGDRGRRAPLDRACGSGRV